MSIGKLSRGADIPINTLRKLRRNTPGYSPKLETLIKVAQYLQVPLEDLFIYVEDEKTGPGE